MTAEKLSHWIIISYFLHLHIDGNRWIVVSKFISFLPNASVPNVFILAHFFTTAFHVFQSRPQELGTAWLSEDVSCVMELATFLEVNEFVLIHCSSWSWVLYVHFIFHNSLLHSFYLHLSSRFSSSDNPSITFSFLQSHSSLAKHLEDLFSHFTILSTMFILFLLSHKNS